VKVFDRQLVTSAAVLAKAIDWSVDHGARLINLSLGTPNTAHADLLGAAVDRAAAAGRIVVSARQSEGVRLLPGSLSQAVGVDVDWSLDRDELVIEFDDDTCVLRGSGYPRPIPGVPPERNLSGISFAVANVTGFLARGVESGAWKSVSDVARALGA
jgi:subtilisin family serine protease